MTGRWPRGPTTFAPVRIARYKNGRIVTVPYSTAQVVVSVEHASNSVPAVLDGLGLPRKWLDSHHGWDPGAATVGKMLANALGAPLHLGRWSRLVADLNRSFFHERVIPPCFSHGGRRIPRNFALDRKGREERLRRYWWPWRRAVERDLDRAIEEHGLAFHISVHSFVERLGGDERLNHVGLLYGPRHALERPLADRLDLRLRNRGYRVRRNYPYSGLDDGFCMRMRVEREADTYLGMEIEMNQRWVRKPSGARRFGRDLIEAFGPEFRELAQPCSDG